MLVLLPEDIQSKVKGELQEVCLLESRDAPDKALDILLARFLVNYYPVAMKKLEKNRKNADIL
ncbi:MAG: hypothetical protein ACTS7E_00035 [Arsenophonus sp. NC-CH8-MAG3]